MGKIRVYQVAKDLGIDSKELVNRVLALGIDVRNYMSSLDAEDVARVKRDIEKQRHEDMVEEEIKPGVTRRRSIRPRSQVQVRKPAAQADEDVAVAPEPVQAPSPPVKKKAGTGKTTRREPAIPPPPESAVIPTARPKVLRGAAPQSLEPTAEDLEEARHEPVVEAPSEEASTHAATPEEGVSVEAVAGPDELESKDVVPVEPIARPEPPRRRKLAAEPVEAPIEAPVRPEPPVSAPRPEPPTPPSVDAKDAAGELQDRVEPPQPPEPPARPEPPVSKRLSFPQETRQFIELPPRAAERPPTTGDTFQLGPPSEPKGKRGRRQEVQPHDLRGTNRQPHTGPRARPARKKRAPVGKKSRQTEITVPKESKRVIRIEETITLQELAKRMGVKATEVIVKLMEMGVGGIHINSMLDADMAKIIAEEFHYQVEDVSVSEEDLLAPARSDADAEEIEGDLEPRPPVVTMLGHVDHGKTSLLDKIRETKVAQGEAGGITQHIGAYQVETPQGVITFIDTPGHEAFTAMRARGAMATDIAVLVVAADDGVMPTTREAISHARAAETPIVVALNKMDLTDANPDLALRGLAEEGLQPEEWGGDTVVVRVSAKTGQGIDQLLEMILLTADMLELRADINVPAHGVVLEAKLEKGRGPVSTVLVQNGILKVGDYVVAGAEHGKVRAMTDPSGRKLEEADPSTPVEILGLSGVPQAGDPVDVVADAKKGEQLAAMRSKAASAAAVPPSSAISDIIKQIQKGHLEANAIETVNLVIKADVQGSVEAIRDKVVSLSTSEVEVKVIHAGVGGITESDVLLASASDPKAIIIGFSVRPAGKARSMAEREHVELRFHNIIYELLDDVKDLMIGRLRPTIKEVDLGRAEVRKVFHIPKVGTIAGCHVLDGKVVRSSHARLVRDSVEVWKGRLGSLKRFNEDVKEVAAGYECGIRLEGYNDVKENDIIEAFETEEIAPTL